MCVIERSPVLETRRLTLRSPQVEDAPRLAELANDYDIARMTLRMPHPYAPKDAEAFVAHVNANDPRRGATFLMEHEDEGPVGVLGFFYDADPLPEMGYWVGRPFWGRGFATESVEAALVWASKRWRKKGVFAGHFADNPASGRVLEKAGFLYTGERRRRVSKARAAMTDTRMMVWLA